VLLNTCGKKDCDEEMAFGNYKSDIVRVRKHQTLESQHQYNRKNVKTIEKKSCQHASSHTDPSGSKMYQHLEPLPTNRLAMRRACCAGANSKTLVLLFIMLNTECASDLALPSMR
jgi:hypothetical protein